MQRVQVQVLAPTWRLTTISSHLDFQFQIVSKHKLHHIRNGVHLRDKMKGSGEEPGKQNNGLRARRDGGKVQLCQLLAECGSHRSTLGVFLRDSPPYFKILSTHCMIWSQAHGGQRTACRVSSILLSLHGFKELNPGHKACATKYFSIKPSP